MWVNLSIINNKILMDCFSSNPKVDEEEIIDQKTSAFGQEAGGRSVTINWQSENTGFVSNKISSTKYNIITIVPISLFLQFTKVSNVFYAFGAILQFIPSISTNSPWATIIPLSYVVLLGMLKEFYADYKRWRQDREENSRECTIRLKDNGDEFTDEKVRCDEIRVGDIVVLKDGEVAPADLLLLTSDGANAQAFVKTTSLDGETNLKVKMAIKQVNDSLYGIKRARLNVDCHVPVADLYRFNARVDYGAEYIEADLNNFIHRGASLQKTGEITGLVLHTSTDCKLVMNQGKYIFKQSKLYRGINYLMLINVLLIIILAGVCAYFNYQNILENQDKAKYIFFNVGDNIDKLTRDSFFSFYLLFNQFVPMELLISLEMVQIFNIVFMDNDTEMTYVDEVRGQLNCQAKSMSLHEDLGQVNYLFCDKTGTLTQNELLFNKWSCGGNILERGMEVATCQEDIERFKNFLRCIVICHDVMMVNIEEDGV